jgi:hypothetical protein
MKRDVLLVNLLLVVIGTVITGVSADRETSQNTGLFLLSLLPMEGFLVVANLTMLLVSLFIKTERKRASGYALSAFVIVIGAVLTTVLGFLTMGKIGG